MTSVLSVLKKSQQEAMSRIHTPTQTPTHTPPHTPSSSSSSLSPPPASPAVATPRPFSSLFEKVIRPALQQVTQLAMNEKLHVRPLSPPPSSSSSSSSSTLSLLHPSHQQQQQQQQEQLQHQQMLDATITRDIVTVLVGALTALDIHTEGTHTHTHTHSSQPSAYEINTNPTHT